MIPPSTSLGQWTPSITRDSAVNRIAAAAQPSATRRHGGGARSAKASATAVTLVAWPLGRSEGHTSELQSLMRISYAVFCLKKNKTKKHHQKPNVKYTTQYLQHSETIAHAIKVK